MPIMEMGAQRDGERALLGSGREASEARWPQMGLMISGFQDSSFRFLVVEVLVVGPRFGVWGLGFQVFRF